MTLHATAAGRIAPTGTSTVGVAGFTAQTSTMEPAAQERLQDLMRDATRESPPLSTSCSTGIRLCRINVAFVRCSRTGDAASAFTDLDNLSMPS